MQAQPCAHVFHVECITAWASVKGIPVSTICIFKCGEDTDLSLPEQAEQLLLGTQAEDADSSGGETLQIHAEAAAAAEEMSQLAENFVGP